MESEFEGKTENVNRQNITMFRPLIEVKTGLLCAACAISHNLLQLIYLHGFQPAAPEFIFGSRDTPAGGWFTLSYNTR